MHGLQGSACGAVAAWNTGAEALALFGGWDGHLSAYRHGGEA